MAQIRMRGFASFLDLAGYLKDDFVLIQKAAGNVDSVIRYAKKNYPAKSINIIAHSLGTLIVSLLSPQGIKKTIFTSIINSNTKFVSMGKDFWKTLENIDLLEYAEELGNKTNLIIFKPKQDDVLENKYFDEYERIKNIKYVKVDGEHNFKDPARRKILFTLIRNFLSS